MANRLTSRVVVHFPIAVGGRVRGFKCEEFDVPSLRPASISVLPTSQLARDRERRPDIGEVERAPRSLYSTYPLLIAPLLGAEPQASIA